MKAFSKYLLGALLAVAFDAHAILIEPADAVLTFSSPSQSVINSQINNYFSSINLNYKPALAYKQNLGGSEEGLASVFTTSFFSDASGGTITSDGTISYNSWDPKYLLVKGGSQDPSAYLFNISSWNGTQALDLSGFWPGPGSIGHVSVYATDGGTTLMLLGMALLGFGAARRFLGASLN